MRLWYPKHLLFAILAWVLLSFVVTFWTITPLGFDKTKLMPDGKGYPVPSGTWHCVISVRICTSGEAIQEYFEGVVFIVPILFMTPPVILPLNLMHGYIFYPYSGILMWYVLFVFIDTKLLKRNAKRMEDPSSKPQTLNPKP